MSCQAARQNATRSTTLCATTSTTNSAAAYVSDVTAICHAILTRADVSGVPGTGKTATVRHVIAQLQREVSTREVKEFHWIEINAMKLTSPNMAYSVLWQRLTEQKQQPKKAQDLLDKRFKQRDTKRPMWCVLYSYIYIYYSASNQPSAWYCWTRSISS